MGDSPLCPRPTAQVNAPSQDLSTGLQLLADRFEDAWQSGQRPQIDEYLPPEGPELRTLLVELVHVDLERRLKAGEAVRVEQYLERYSELAVDQVVVLSLLASEFALRRRSEPNLLLEDYLQRFPLLGEALLAQLATDQPQSSLPVSTVEKNPAVPPIGDGDQDAGGGGKSFLGTLSHSVLPRQRQHGRSTHRRGYRAGS